MKDTDQNGLAIEDKKNELKLKYIELQLKKRELELQEKNANLNHDLEKFKIIITGVVVTLITSIISWQIQNQQVEIERLSREQEYLTSFSGQALHADLKSRYAFADYLSTIAHSRSSRNRWSAYKKRVQLAINLEEAKEQEISDLRDKIASLSDTNSPFDSAKTKENKEQIEELEKIIHDKEKKLETLKQSQTIGPPAQEFVFNYDLDSPIVEGARFKWQDAIVSPTGNKSIPINQSVVDNITKAALFLTEVEKLLGRPVEITGWYRTPEYNARVGGPSQSKHLEGHAVDITVNGMSTDDLYKKLDVWWGDRGALGTHYNMVLHMDGRGYRARWRDE